MIFKLIQYLIGVVRVRIEGEFPEKLLNVCIARGILLWDITKNSNNNIYCRMRLPDFFRIRPLVRKSHTRLTVLRRYGLPFVCKAIKGRPMLLGGLVMFVLLLYGAGECVWFVTISGPPEIPVDKVRTVAFNQGLRPGALKSSVDRKNIEKAIVLEIPEVAWAGIDFTGTRAVIDVVPKTLPGPDDRTPAHVVAVKDGTITEIIVLSGQGLVSKGKTVKKGDIMIAGTEFGSARTIRANGIVQARVWYESDGQASTTEVLYHPTGRKRLAADLEVATQKVLPLWLSEPSYNQFATQVIYKKAAVWRNSDLVVEATIKLYSELVTETVTLSPEAAQGKAREEAMTALQALLPEDAQILSQTTLVLPSEDPVVIWVRVKMETREDIGQILHIAP